MLAVTSEGLGTGQLCLGGAYRNCGWWDAGWIVCLRLRSGGSLIYPIHSGGRFVR
jgi:hypothetical protein